MKKVLFLLGHLTDLDIEWMIQNGQKLQISEQDFLIHKGEAPEDLYIILSGELTIQDQDHVIAAIGPGEIVGEMSFLEARPPAVNVIARENCEIYSISKTLVTERLQKDPTFKANFYYSLALFLSDRLRKTTSQLGFGSPEEEDQIDTNVMEIISQAGARFSQILHKFSEI